MEKTLSNKESDNQYSVEQRTLDSFNLEFEINLIKVDVEGFELEFFVGASETIRKNNFPPIIFELWSGKSWYEEKAEKTKRILCDFGNSFNGFGKEIFAQNPNHPFQCIIDRNGNKFKLRRA